MWNIALLMVAIVCETTAAGLLKRSDGLTRLWPSVGMLVAYGAELLLLSAVLKVLPIGPVYAVWGGVGTALTTLIGLVIFGDRLTSTAWAGLGFVMVGVVLLSMSMTVER
jgi:multidrug transporter EmrE-like cation transporter